MAIDKVHTYIKYLPGNYVLQHVFINVIESTDKSHTTRIYIYMNRI